MISAAPNDPWSTGSPRRGGVLSAALMAAVIAASVGHAAWLFASGRVHNNDFKHLWAGAVILAQGGNPYDPDVLLLAARQYGFESINPYVYLPATGLMLRPLAWLSFPAAAAVWFWGNLALAWACVLWGPRALAVPFRDRARWAGALFLTLPTALQGFGVSPFLRQMTAGQLNVGVLAAILGSVTLLIRGREVAAGVILGLAAAFKIAPAFLIVVLAGMRRWRAAAAAVGTLGLGLALSVGLVGWETHRAAIEVLRQMGYGSSTWAEFQMDFYRDPFNQSFNALFHHLVTENPHTRPWFDWGPRTADALTWLASLGTLGLFLASVLRYRRRPYFSPRWGEAETELFMAGVIVMLLLPSLMWDHYMVQALAPLLWLFGAMNVRRRPDLAIFAAAAWGLFAVPWVHTGTVWRQGAGVLLLSIRLWGALLLLAVLTAQSGRRWREGITRR